MNDSGPSELLFLVLAPFFLLFLLLVTVLIAGWFFSRFQDLVTWLQQARDNASIEE